MIWIINEEKKDDFLSLIYGLWEFELIPEMMQANYRDSFGQEKDEFATLQDIYSI